MIGCAITPRTTRPNSMAGWSPSWRRSKTISSSCETCTTPRNSRCREHYFSNKLYSNVTGQLGLGPRHQAWDQAVRRVGGPLGGIERVPSRFSLFLPSDPRIGPGNVVLQQQLFA